MAIDSMAFYKRAGERDLGLALQSWHSSGGDPIYALGSVLYSETATVAFSPEAAQVVRGALANLRREALDQDARGRELAGSDYDRAAYHFDLNRELRDLISRVERRFADLLKFFPDKEGTR